MPAIHVVPSFHYDVVYLEDYQTYLKKSFAIIDKALAMLADHPDYRFLIEQVILVEAYCRKHPGKVPLLRQFAAEGRLHFAPGMYVMPDLNMPDGESQFLQVAEGFKWLGETLDYRPSICWIADCWGHHAQLPQILTACGYTGYAFWRCMNPDLRKNHFLWRGLDGTEIKTHWLYLGYAPIRFPDQHEVVNAPELAIYGCAPEQLAKLVEAFKEIGAGSEILLCNGGDFMMPQGSAPATLAKLRKRPELADMRFSDPAAYFAALDWTHAVVYQGEFNSALQGTFSSNIAIKQLTRECAYLFHALEKLAVLTGTPLERREALLKNILKQQFHDTICGTIADAPLADTLRELESGRRKLLKALRRTAPRHRLKEAALFNSTQFDRRDIIIEDGKYAEIAVAAHSSTAIDRARRLHSTGETRLPAVFANDFYQAEIDAEGFISSLKIDGGELVRPGAAEKFGGIAMQLDYGDLWLHFDAPLNGGSRASALTHNDEDPLHGRGSELVNRSSFAPTIQSAEIVFRSPELLVIRQTGQLRFWRLAVDFSVEVSFRRNSPRINYRVAIRPDGKHYRLRAIFPTAIGADGEAAYEIPFGIQIRNRALHAAQNWLDLADAAKGLALLNRGLPSNSTDTAGNLVLNFFRSAAMEYKAPSKRSFGRGENREFEYSILPHGKRDFAAIVREGLLLNAPLRPVTAELAATAAFVPDAPNVIVSAFRRSGDKVFIRLYECAGKAATTRVAIPANLKSWAVADGLEEVKGEFQPVENGKLELQFKPFEIKALVLAR